MRDGHDRDHANLGMQDFDLPGLNNIANLSPPPNLIAALPEVTGSPSGFSADIELSSLDGTNGFKLSGTTELDLFGNSVATAGDINGDGIPDLIVGAPGTGVMAGPELGTAYVVFGHQGAFNADIVVSALNGTNGFSVTGTGNYNELGFSVHSAGDVNGDGFADIVIGSVGNSEAYVVFGHSGAFAQTMAVSALDGTNGFALTGGGDETGLSVSSGGDINGDGFADFIVGAPRASAPGKYSGASYVVFGHAGGFSATLDLSALNGTNGFMIAGAGAYDNSGVSVASAGDVNGDGFDDLIVGADAASVSATLSGASYVIFGHAGGFDAGIELSALNGTNGFTITGAAGSDFSGKSVSSAGDINGDGFADIAIGAYGADPGGSYSGASYVLFGHAGGFGTVVNVSQLGGRNGFTISGAAAGDESGGSVASAGDVNGDGFDDLLVGASFADSNGGNSGASYVIFGHAGGFDANIDLANLDGTNGFKIAGVAAGDRSGFSVSGAGDLNGDGFDDLIVGSRYGRGGATDSGAAYVIFGRAPTESVTRIGSVIGQTISGGAFDDTLSGLDGDDTLNGNAGDDNLLGGAGNDIIHAASGDDTANGGSGNDHIDGGNGDESFSGGSGNDVLTVGTGASLLNGGSGNDVLTAGDGATRMVGGSGNDTYVVGGVNDVVVEAAGAGTDTVKTALTHYTLGANVEKLVHTGASNFTGTGNGLANTITGGKGNDTLDGKAGADTLSGGLGNDTYIVDNAGDVVKENAKAGTDTVKTALSSYTLGANVENLIHTGSADFTGTGNTQANTITGSTGDDTLSGAGGNDVLNGGAGNDTLIGGAGADKLSGGSGADIFQYASATESSGVNHDTILGLDFASAHFSLSSAVAKIDAAVNSGSLSTATFDADLAVAMSGHLTKHGAILFTATAGTLKNHTFLVVDGDGHAGYQNGHDFVIDVTGAANLADLTAASFI